LDAEKHVDTLVRALAVVKASRPVHGLIIGTGNSEASLRGLAHKLGLAANISFTGQVSDADRAILLRCGTLFVMPSPAELQSLATLEAMASGQPIVAADAGALSELCHNGDNGYLFEVDDATGLAGHIARIISDPDLRLSMSRASLRIARTHELGHVIHRFEEIYAGVIAAKSRESLVSV
jgi:glycosyltransferase involved in cell wall biosynthesis